MTKISIASSALRISASGARQSFNSTNTRRALTGIAALCCATAGGAHAATAAAVPTTGTPAIEATTATVPAQSLPVATAIRPVTSHAAVKAAAGGPFEVATGTASTNDMQVRSLFMTWKKLDSFNQGSAIAIPAVQPVDHLAFTSNFGVRSDPFRGTAAFHAGVDIPGPVGTPVYATADGLIDKAERSGGYGNMVEINHGKGIQTRYGHLSKILVAPYTRVHRGQLIALMGSTGRSTGPHLHYEVRIDGSAVNPLPFLQNADYLLAAHDKSVRSIPVSVGTSDD